ncbi:MAG: hypothetical protein ACTSUE_01845 [Promethearchaeota archaeon]
MFNYNYYGSQEYLDAGTTAIFEINRYLVLKLQHGHTFIYVDGKPFGECKPILLEISSDVVHDYDEIDSIDDLILLTWGCMDPYPYPYPHPYLYRDISLPPGTEFWVYASSLQMWYENGYNTRLLHSKLAFPLLKALAAAGDELASRIYYHELSERLRTGRPEVVFYILEHVIKNDDWRKISVGDPRERAQLFDKIHLIFDFRDSFSLERQPYLVRFFLRFISAEAVDPSPFSEVLRSEMYYGFRIFIAQDLLRFYLRPEELNWFSFEDEEGIKYFISQDPDTPLEALERMGVIDDYDYDDYDDYYNADNDDGGNKDDNDDGGNNDDNDDKDDGNKDDNDDKDGQEWR